MTIANVRSALYWLLPLLFGLVLGAAISPSEDRSEPIEPPAGELLVAAARMQDPRFAHSVIVLLRHDKTGAFGIIINRPLGERRFADLLASAGGRGADPDDRKLEGTIRVCLGGPVQPQLGFVVHSPEYRRPETLLVGDKLAMTATRDVLRDIAHHQGPAKYLFALGYAGWGAGQLENEFARRDWFTAPGEADLLFDIDRDAVWDTAVSRRTREL